MKTMTSILGYTAAAFTLGLMVVTPFWFMGSITRGIADFNIQANPVYVGSKVARTILRDGYEVQIHHPVVKQAPCQDIVPFLQLDWNPASNLPAVVEESLDLKGDGQVDLRVRIAVPSDPKAPLSADVTCTSGVVNSVQGIRKQSLSLLCVRDGERILLRIPWNERS